MFLLVFVAANRDYLAGRAWPIWDADGFFAPFYVFVADLARHGRLLTWNPFVNAGSPDFADPQVGAFDPVLLLAGLATGPHVLGFLVYWLAMWSLAGLGILCLARRLGCGPAPALVVALGFAFSGFFLGHAQHTSFVRSLAFLGLILWRLDVALAERRLRPALEAGVLWGLSGLAGYPAILFLNGVAVVAWTLGRAFLLQPGGSALAQAPPEERVSRPGAAALRHGALALVLFAASGALVLLPTYLGTIHEAAGYTSRSGALPREIAVESNALHPRALATFASPYLAVLPQERIWDYTNRSSCGLYAGALVPLLALFALVSRPRSAWRWALVAVLALALCAALSRVLPLRGWLYDWVPPTRYFRHASVFRGYALFALAVLALAGARDLLDSRRDPASRARTWSVAAAFALIAGSLAWLAISRFDAVTALARATDAGAARTHLYWTWLAAPACIAAAWLLRERPRARLVPLAAMLALAITDVFACMRFSEPIMRNPPERVAELWNELERDAPRSIDLLKERAARGHVSNASSGFGPGFSSKNVLRRQPMFRSYTVLANEIHQEWSDDPRAWQPYAGEQRFYFVPRAGRGSAGRPNDLKAFERRAKRLDHPPLVIEGEGMAALETVPIAELPAAIPVTPVLREYTLRTLSFDVTVPEDGWLLVTDRWARSWRARVDGAPARLWKGNFLFRALQVRAGASSVELTYRPLGYPWLTLLSWFVVASILAGPAASWLVRRVRGRSSAGAASGPSIRPL